MLILYSLGQMVPSYFDYIRVERFSYSCVVKGVCLRAHTYIRTYILLKCTDTYTVRRRNLHNAC